MTLLKLIKNCLDFVTQDDKRKSELTISNLSKDASYSAFVNNVLEEINRAIQEITPYHKLQGQSEEIEIEKNNQAKIKVAFNKSNYDEIFKIEYVDNEYNTYPLNFRIYDNSNILVDNPRRDGKLHIVYYPLVRALTVAQDLDGNDLYDIIDEDNSTELSDLGITDQICMSVIPYLVKSNLWQEVEPELAQNERNKGLQNLMALPDGCNIDYVQDTILLVNDYD